MSIMRLITALYVGVLQTKRNKPFSPRIKNPEPVSSGCEYMTLLIKHYLIFLIILSVALSNNISRASIAVNVAAPNEKLSVPSPTKHAVNNVINAYAVSFIFSPFKVRLRLY